mgnify:CR=1 FL=1
MLIRRLFFRFDKKMNFKKIFSLVAIFISISYVNAQHWTDLMLVPNPNYFEVKTAFDKEWEGKEHQKGQGISLFHRWEMFMLKHMDINGNYIEKALPNKTSSINLRSGTTGNWSLMGPTYSPGPDGYNNDGIGRVLDVAFHPTDSNTYYVAASSGGVWKTTDGGDTYNYLSQAWKSNTIYGIGINGNNSNEIWVALRSSLMHSINGGNSWTEIDISPTIIYTKKFAFNYSQNLLLVADGFGGNHYSTDGQSWTNIIGINGRISDFLINPTNSSIVYAATKTGLFKSTNGGKVFTPLAATGVDFGTTQNRIAMSKASPNTIWLLSISSSKLNGVYKSSTGGSSFSKVLTPTSQIFRANSTYSSNATDLFGGQGYIHAAIGVSQTDPNQVFVAGVSIFMTEDGGTNWVKANAGWADKSPHVDNLNIRFDPVNDYPFSCNDGGVYKGLNDTDNYGNYIWKPLNENLGITQMYKVAVSYNGKTVLTGQQDNGSFLFSKDENEWKFMVIGDGMNNAIDPSNHEKFYIANQSGSIYYSENGGKSNNNVLNSSGLPENSSFYTVIEAHPTNPDVLFHLRDNLWKSSDNGKNWVNLTAAIGKDFSTGNVAISYNNPDVIAVASWREGIYLSIDGGASWSSITGPSGSNKFESQIFLHSNDANKFWVEHLNNIYYTTNKGVSWTEYTTWPEMDYNDIVHIDGTDDGLIIATENGVYIKENGSLNLEVLNNKLPAVSVRDVDISYCNNEIYAATYGLGLWKIAFDMESSSCCKLAPTVKDVKLICNDENTLAAVSDQINPTYSWTLEGALIGGSSSSISVSKGGAYEVFTVNGSCESGHAKSQVHVLSQSNNFPLCIDFEDDLESVSVIKDWGAEPMSIVQNSVCSASGNKILGFTLTPIPPFNGLYNKTKDSVSFVLKEIDLTYAVTGELSFDISTVLNSSSNVWTGLVVEISTNCGTTFTEIFNKNRGDLAITSTWTSDFAPSSCADWKSFDVDLTPYLGGPRLIKFTFYSAENSGQSFFGGNLYMDNICLTGQLEPGSGVNELGDFNEKVTIYPNPSQQILNIDSETEVQNLKIYTLAGQIVNVSEKTNKINLSNLKKGSYFIVVTTQKSVQTFNLVKN